MSDRHHVIEDEGDDLVEVTFELRGETFTCVPVPPGGLFREQIARLVGGDSAAKARSWLGFIEVCMDTEEFERFTAFIDDAKHRVGPRTVEKIVNALIEEYTGRPTKPSTPSQRGRSNTPPTSTDVSSLPDSTPDD